MREREQDIMKSFNGKLAGKKLGDFNLSELKTVDSYKERSAMVDKLMLVDGNAHPFFTTYFDQYYDVSPKQSGYLAEETMVCKFLEIVGTYLLSALDIKSERKIEYRFWKDERDFKKSQESENLNTSSMENGSNDNNVEVIDMFVDKKNEKNQKIVQDIYITKQDIKDIVEIRNYENAISYLKSPSGIEHIKKHIKAVVESGACSSQDNKRLMQISSRLPIYLSRYIRTMREDQVLIKKAIKVPIIFKNPLKDMGAETDWFTIINFNNRKCIKVLLESLYQKDMHGDDFRLILWDLYEFLTKRIKLSKREREIVEMFAVGYDQVGIAKEWGVSEQNVSNIVGRIITKVQDSGYDIE